MLSSPVAWTRGTRVTRSLRMLLQRRRSHAAKSTGNRASSFAAVTAVALGGLFLMRDRLTTRATIASAVKEQEMASDYQIRLVPTLTHGRVLVREARGVPLGLLVGFHGYMENAEMQMQRLEAIPGGSDWTLV